MKVICVCVGGGAICSNSGFASQQAYIYTLSYSILFEPQKRNPPSDYSNYKRRGGRGNKTRSNLIDVMVMI